MSNPIPREDAEGVLFATAESTRQRPGENDIKWASRTYDPSFPGLHVCGADHEENRFFTIFDMPAKNDAHARAMWEAAKAECAVDVGEHDFVVDLNTGDYNHIDEFYSVRQLLPRIVAIARGASPAGIGGGG